MNIILLFLFLVSAPLGALRGYECPSTVDEGVWEQVQPFLLPEDHKLKRKLDKIFKDNKTRFLETHKTLLDIGFEVTGTPHTQKLYVMRHKNLKGWIFKIYTETQTNTREWFRFIERCKGALAAKESIIVNHAERKFKAPEKYIYPLPPYEPTEGRERKKNFILVAEDMDILDPHESHRLWKSNRVYRSFLNLFWNVVTQGGLADSFYIDNCPFSYDGKIAFVDTEQYHRWPIHYPRLLEYLSSDMHMYWSLLIHNKGPK